MASVKVEGASHPRPEHESAHRAPPAASATEVVFAQGRALGPLATAGALQALQRSAGNAAAALLLQREYDMREYTDHTPISPFTEIHFRFDTDTLPGFPHEFLHITVQNDDRSRVVHYYYDSWNNTWRRTGPGGNPLGGSLGAVQAAAITWGEQKAKGYGTQFRQPAAVVPQAKPTAADWVGLGSLTQAEIEKQARARAREEQVAKQRQLKAEAKRLEQEAKKAKQEALKKQRAEQAAREQAAREAAEAEARARTAAIEDLAFSLMLAFDLPAAVARARATEMIDARATAPPMSEAALAMYG